MLVFVLHEGLSPKNVLSGLAEVFNLHVCERSRGATTYWDTFDWRFHRREWSFTTSPSGRMIRVSLQSANGEAFEVVVPRTPVFALDLPPGDLSERVRSAAKHRRLLPRAQAEWATTLISLLDEEEKTVVRLRLRTGSVLTGDGNGRIPLLPRLECLPLKGYGSEERKVKSYLRNELGLSRDGRTELDVVYGIAGQMPGDYSSSFRLTLSPEMTAYEAARRIHLTLLDTIERNRDGVIRDLDTEFLHDFRVAVRRTRAALKQLEHVFPEEATAHFSQEFQWLGSRTGPARDLDVYLLNIPSYRAALTTGADRDLGPLVRLLREKKRNELSKLRACLRSRRFRRLMEEWRAFLETSLARGILPGGATLPISEVASKGIPKAFDKVLRRGREIDRETPADALHRLRIQCKRLRYLITFLRSLFPPSTLDPFIEELKALQDHLGDFNDLQVQRVALLRSAEELMATRTGPPATLLAMGQLMGQLEGAQAREREAFHRHFQTFSRLENQEQFRQIFAPGSGTDPLTTDEVKSP